MFSPGTVTVSLFIRVVMFRCNEWSWLEHEQCKMKSDKCKMKSDGQ